MTSLTDDAVRAAVGRAWGLGDATVTAHHGGMNSATWFVAAGDEIRWVAKAVPPPAAAAFAAGLRVASMVDRAGIPTGAAVPALDGSVVVDVAGHPLALLAYLPGEPLETSDQRTVGATLAAVHRALAGATVEGQQEFHRIEPAAAHLGIRDWIRPAVTAAVRDLDMSAMTWGLLHADPSPEAFRRDPATGVCGLLDWPSAVYGPLLYDLASAVMYVGGPDAAAGLLSSYLDDGPLAVTEVHSGLRPMFRFRLAIQADYFAHRIATRDLTGIATDGDNETGLEDARLALAEDQRSGR